MIESSQPPPGGAPIANILKLFSNIAFKGVGTYTPMDAGSYDVAVKVAGTDTTALSVKGLNLAMGTVNTVYAFGLLATDPKLSAGVSTDFMLTTLPATGASAEELAGQNAGNAGVMLAVIAAVAGLVMLGRKVRATSKI